MGFPITSGNIAPGVLYVVIGAQSVNYNSGTYTTGQKFRGVTGVKTFTFSGSGSQEVNEVTEILGFALEYVVDGNDYPASFPAGPTEIKGFALEYVLNLDEQIVQEVTKITGFGLELLDYPFYAFEITETRG